MEAKGWIEAESAASENNRRAKYYRLTKAGRKQLEAEKESWDRLTAVVAQVMQYASTPNTPTIGKRRDRHGAEPVPGRRLL